MLNEIQALYKEFKKNNEGLRLFERLDSLKFYPFPLNGFNLSEDLYIKMNARGKQLTDFENYKADLINWMKSDKNPEKDKFNQIPEGKALPFYLGISMKLDNEWTKLFWRITKDYDPELRDPKTKQLIYPDGKLVDPLFMRFFKRYFHLRNILITEEKVSVEQLEEDPLVKYFYGVKGIDEATIYDSNDFETNYVSSLSYDCIRDIEIILDRLCEEHGGKTVFDIVGECMNAPWAEDKEKQFYSPRIEQTGRMALCACFEYLRRNEFNEERFREWMRVIWNFIDEPTIRTVVGMIGALRFIQNVGVYSGDIYTYLTTVKDEDRPKRFAEQFSEEVIKASLIRGDQDTDDVSWDSLIKDADNKKAVYQKWSRLNELIGDSKGSNFRKIAQSYVLTSLIHSANSYMKTLTDRYTLKVTPGTFVISLEDAYQGFVSRAASTISGGESFLVSLSLALALSDIGQQLQVDTLFIDEGFGTLSGEPLQKAVETLRSLHSTAGRHVGIISHVEELQERIPVQIQVNQEGNNSSSVIKIVP